MLQVLGALILGVVVLILTNAAWAQSEPDDADRAAVGGNLVLLGEPVSLDASGGLGETAPAPYVEPRLDNMER